ncbi:MAG: response regulator [Thermoplasmatota archaeon]
MTDLPGLHRTRILVVDDETDIRGALAMTLTSLFPQVDVLQAEDGAAGLATLARGPVDLILSDFKMPGMDGVTFLRRARESYPDVMRILMTAFPDLSLAVEAINVDHVEAFLMKPFDRATIRAAVGKALTTKRTRDQRESAFNRSLEGLRPGPEV